MAQIEGKNLNIGYDGNVVLGDVNFTIEKGDFISILGKNGVGKSTLMKTLLGLIPPISGEIVFGEGLSSKEIGYLPQQTDFQKDFPASVREIVLSGCVGKMGFRPFYNKEEKKKAQDAMVSMGIDSLSGKCYRDLSGGQKQRVLLARALCATEEILLLDEPVTGLDAVIAEEFYKIVKELNEKKNITIIMITHDIIAAKKYSKKILNLENDTEEDK